jgi:hypothetical protein
VHFYKSQVLMRWLKASEIESIVLLPYCCFEFLQEVKHIGVDYPEQVLQLSMDCICRVFDQPVEVALINLRLNRQEARCCKEGGVCPQGFCK